MRKSKGYIQRKLQKPGTYLHRMKEVGMNETRKYLDTGKTHVKWTRLLILFAFKPRNMPIGNTVFLIPTHDSYSPSPSTLAHHN